MNMFYKHLKTGKSKSESLQMTQLEFINSRAIEISAERGIKVKGKTETRTDTTHPYYWAPFVLIGE